MTEQQVLELLFSHIAAYSNFLIYFLPIMAILKILFDFIFDLIFNLTGRRS